MGETDSCQRGGHWGNGLKMVKGLSKLYIYIYIYNIYKTHRHKQRGGDSQRERGLG